MKLLIALMMVLPALASADECRSTATKHQFDKLMGYPHGRKGYVVDHVCALPAPLALSGSNV